MREASHPARFAANSPDLKGEFPLNPTEYFFYLTFLIARHHDLAFESALAAVGLSAAKWRALAIIRRIDPCSMKTLALFSTVERTTLTRAVDQLVEDGLVDRWVPRHDRRQVNLVMTEAGETVYQKGVAALLELNRRITADLPQDELRRSCRLMQSVLRELVGDEAVAAELVSFGRIREGAA